MLCPTTHNKINASSISLLHFDIALGQRRVSVIARNQKMMTEQLKPSKYCKYHRKENCKFGQCCYFIHESTIIIRCPYGKNCVHKNCWYSHVNIPSNRKIEEICKAVEELRTRLTSVENRTAYEHHCSCDDKTCAKDKQENTNRNGNLRMM